MRTIHEFNDGVAVPVESRAPAILARVRALDPHLVEALADPDNFDPGGRLRIRAVARATDRTVHQVRQDFATLRQLVGL